MTNKDSTIYLDLLRKCDDSTREPNKKLTYIFETTSGNILNVVALTISNGICLLSLIKTDLDTRKRLIDREFTDRGVIFSLLSQTRGGEPQ
jgi:hypothetical protein